MNSWASDKIPVCDFWPWHCDFLLGIAECRAFSATGMGLKSSLTMVALCWAQLLREVREALGVAKNSKTTRLQMLSSSWKFLRFTKCEPTVKLHWKVTVHQSILS